MKTGRFEIYQIVKNLNKMKLSRVNTLHWIQYDVNFELFSLKIEFGQICKVIKAASIQIMYRNI